MKQHLPQPAKRMRTGFKVLLFLFCTPTCSVYAQDCTANAGGNAIVCGSSTTLTGSVGGSTAAAAPAWSFVSGPVTPVIGSPSSLTTAVSGMTADGNYIFQLSQPCATGTAISTVTITAHPRPASFTAGPDITSVCATTGATTLSGVIPAGFTGTWRSVNIYNLARFGTAVTTNSSFSSTTSATPVFSLTNKANHNIDPAYYTILRISSADGVCSYEDTAIVRFIPHTKIVFPAVKTTCHAPGSSVYFIDPSAGSPVFATNQPGVAGSPAAGTSVTLTVVSQPAGAALSYNRIDENGRLYLNGITVTGTYKFTVMTSNACGNDTTPELTYNFTGTTPNLASFQPSGHGAPEQLVVYATTGSGGEIHCNSMAGSSASEDFFFSIHPSDSPTVVSTITPISIFPPGGAPTVSIAGAGTYSRTATVTPPSGGWQAGTYAFSLSLSNGSCATSQRYYIHVSDNNRPSISVPDLSVCYPGTGSISATIPLPAIYKGVVNSSYFQDLPAYYNFTLISKPAGSATPTYTTSNLRSITSTSTTISNINMAGDYTFSITPFNGNSVGPFLEAEYSCSGAAFTDTFTVHVETLINSNAGSDHNPGCSDSTALAGNATGAGTGLWAVLSAPAGAAPTIVAPTSPLSRVRDLDVLGTYSFSWTITTPLGGCISADTVVVTTTCSLPVGLLSFTAAQANDAVSLQWTTASEQDNKGFALEHSTNGHDWHAIAFADSKAEKGNSKSPLQYSYLHLHPAPGRNFYRLKQTDLYGSYQYSQTRDILYDVPASVSITPNPAADFILLQGLSGINKISILNTTGQIMFSKDTDGSPTQQVQTGQLPAGLYILVICNEQGTATHRKLVKQ
ncbi:MAG: T9SS type A sorting domain-containing protein [Chitinophagaceae bacterium]|nr:T9SS type A sorting domain-containing protein [Chitinophagaceae bacterium]